MGGKRDNKERDIRRVHPFPRVSRYNRGGDILEGDITKIRVFKYQRLLWPNYRWATPRLHLLELGPHHKY